MSGASTDPADRTDEDLNDEDLNDEDLNDEDERAVSTVPLPTEDGGEVVLHQQNAGPGNQMGAGEFKQSDDTSFHKEPADAAVEEAELEASAPTNIDDDAS